MINHQGNTESDSGIGVRRPSIPTAPTPIPTTPTPFRGHSSSQSVSSVGTSGRNTIRRKSISTALTSGALAALSITDSGVPVSTSRRPGRTTLTDPASLAASVPSFTPGLADPVGDDMARASTCAVADGPSLASTPSSLAPISSGGINKARIRRASEGSRLIKADGRRAKDIELRCDKCGKSYKHSSCLAKHLWEHTPQWALTSKLLISKHQQVQLLEAASVLVAMNQDSVSTKCGVTVKTESAANSPSQTGSSPDRDTTETVVSSTNTSPPPTTGGISSLRYLQQQHQPAHKLAEPGMASQHGFVGTGFDSSPAGLSQSRFQVSESAPDRTYMGEYHLPSFGRAGIAVGRARPAAYGGPADVAVDGEVGSVGGLLLSSSFEPRSLESYTAATNIPPVPPLPDRFLHTGSVGAGGRVSMPPRSPLTGLSYSPSQPISFQRGEPVMPERPPVSPIEDIKFFGIGKRSTSPIVEEGEADSGTETSNKWRGEEDLEEGVFGRMED